MNFNAQNTVGFPIVFHVNAQFATVANNQSRTVPLFNAPDDDANNNYRIYVEAVIVRPYNEGDGFTDDGFSVLTAPSGEDLFLGNAQINTPTTIVASTGITEGDIVTLRPNTAQYNSNEVVAGSTLYLKFSNASGSTHDLVDMMVTVVLHAVPITRVA